MTGKTQSRRYSEADFDRDFPNDDACLEWLMGFLYPHGVHCAKCGRITKHHRIKARKCYCCDVCGHQVHPTAGTIYHKSSTSLRLWFKAVFIMSATRCETSAKQLERTLGVTYKTAWRMFKQIRSMLADDDPDPLRGQVEIDETYIGPKVGNLSLSKRKARGKLRGGSDKTIVLGAVERKGRIRTKIIARTDRKTLERVTLPMVHGHATVFTDHWGGYDNLSFYYSHLRIDHSKFYVDGPTHTNTIEGFWGNFKSGARGTCKHISLKYLQSYLNEYGFRYSRRKWNVPMFWNFMAQTRQESWWMSYNDRI